ncbi:MAG: SH3 domain-containing protein [Clostridia bacterium]|nr:SH3 domain-containing protein [Clostridia bacterium]
MKRFGTIWAVAVLMVTALSAALADGGYGTGEVICLGVSLRVDHKTSAKRIRTLDNGETFTILEEYDGWYRVNHEGTEGWLLADYVAENPQHIYTRKSNIPARAWASKSSKRVGLIDANQRLTVIRELEDYWIVSFRNAMCYVSKDASVWTDWEVKQARPLFTIEMTEDTQLRTGPGKAWAAYRNCKAGERFQVVGEEGDWYKLRCDDYFAYMWKPLTKVVN